jgi:hypothetical protein
MANLNDTLVNGNLKVTDTIYGSLHGNVTGNVSGSAGSCTGNAATATTASSCTGNAATATTASSCTGNSATATKATQDSDGNTIKDTYLKLSGGTMTGAITGARNKMFLCFRDGSTTWESTVYHGDTGNEALVFATSNVQTSFMFVNGENSRTNASTNRWQSLTPGLQVKNNSVSIGALIGNDVTPTYKLAVNGNTNVNGTLSLSANGKMAYNSSTESIDFTF